MVFLILLLSAALAVGHVVLALGLNSAPEGEETLNGFTMVWHNVDSTKRDVVCIWERHNDKPVFFNTEDHGGLCAA